MDLEEFGNDLLFNLSGAFMEDGDETVEMPKSGMAGGKITKKRVRVKPKVTADEEEEQQATI